jgi:hypothetical protein
VRRRARQPFIRALVAVAAIAPLLNAQSRSLSNGALTAEFDDRGLASLTDTERRAVYRFRREGFAVTLDGHTYASDTLPRPSRRDEPGRVTFTWSVGPYRLAVVYALDPGWRFLSKQVFVASAPAERFHLGDVTVIAATLDETPADVYVPRSPRPELGTGDYGGAVRFADGRGLLAVAQNPFLEFRHEGPAFAVRYVPDVEWRLAYGPHAADRALLAPYRLSGSRLPARLLPEWELPRDDEAQGLDRAEIAAFTDMVRAFLLYRPEMPITVFVGWCVNDYQIDVATAEGRSEYKRVLDRAAELGARYVLYAPSNSALSRREASVDDWSWEHVLWLGLGQKIRSGKWDPRSDTLPPSVREILDYARSKGQRLLAYVYPVVPFAQNPEWLASRSGAPSRRYASLGVRSLQDWLIESLVAFHQRTGIGGYAFDHTFLTFDGTSRYAQWWGWRRVLEELRRRIPGIVIDGRQAYQWYGPWSWLAGSYPHPTFHDEQPESFVPFPDLHFDRVSADRQRFTAFRYRNHEFAPSEIVPGFAMHQTPRPDETGEMPAVRTDRGTLLTRFRARDWDYLGWRYSLLSSIATGGWNNVLNMIPARDPEEFRHFPEADAQWLRDWLDWTVRNKEFLRQTRTILGPPAIGRVDGTAATRGDSGYVFLFNPNGRPLAAQFALDSSIGLRGNGQYLVTEVHPVAGRKLGKPGAGWWAWGDRVAVSMDGGSALVLEIAPAPREVRQPALFGAPGTVRIAGDTIHLEEIRGEVGTSATLVAVLPQGVSVSAARVNGGGMTFRRLSDRMLAFDVRFDGAPFRHYQQVGDYDSAFDGGTFRARVTIPRRVFDQLAARRRAWPIPWTAEDSATTWLVPERLLLFVQIAEPDDAWNVGLRIDGRPVPLRKAYSSIRPVRRAFVGFYADVSSLAADVEHSVELSLPRLRAGQFQGLFFENVETEYTQQVGR